MKKFIPVLIYIACVLISRKFAGEYWVVGPVFGIAAIFINFESVRKKFSLSHLGFVIASAVVYALVFWISDKGWKFKEDWLDMAAGSLTGAVVIGSLLMPFIHILLFNQDAKAARSTSLALIASWYVIVLFSYVDETIGFRPNIDYLLAGIALWQGIYLYRLKIK